MSKFIPTKAIFGGKPAPNSIILLALNLSDFFYEKKEPSG
jgi:hypothetical protein